MTITFLCAIPGRKVVQPSPTPDQQAWLDATKNATDSIGKAIHQEVLAEVAAGPRDCPNECVGTLTKEGFDPHCDDCRPEKVEVLLTKPSCQDCGTTKDIVQAPCPAALMDNKVEEVVVCKACFRERAVNS